MQNHRINRVVLTYGAIKSTIHRAQKPLFVGPFFRLHLQQGVRLTTCFASWWSVAAAITGWFGVNDSRVSNVAGELGVVKKRGIFGGVTMPGLPGVRTLHQAKA